ncbi:D-alanyl-D-alanine carboxypeptidase family protein [Mycolicibacterium fallax]|uniref:D-alanyl-D-alanine carboxypeptidase family protein n=1 Tax=Mycolicibacterium fallax TaxID=1793 RepID=UPI000A14DF48|nr:serine hydrolase [Mycolicibacterium fallax]BBY96790.1 D-alanyl-D-alanine carboxypeptidase [Mycolicibacterium fallax]
MAVPPVLRIRRATVAVLLSVLLVIAGLPTASAVPTAVPPDGPARAWVLADIASGAILASKDPTGRYAPASTIKTLLAMTVLDNLRPETAVRATAAHTKVECSCVGLVPGQVYTARQLLDALLMVSGNDAANLLGDMLGGYRAAITRMTNKAASLGATSTRVMSPSGLDGPGWETVTTPRDLAIIYRAAMKYPVLIQIFQQREASFPNGKGGAKTLHAQNELLARYPGDVAGKTGFTNLAGKTYAGVAQRNGRALVVVLMKGSGDLYGQAIGLLDWGFAQASGTLG